MSAPKFIYLHGFGVGPKGVKYSFMREYLDPEEVEAVSWHQPNYAETKLSTAIANIERYLVENSNGRKWNVVGSSTGALIALHVAARQDKLINKLLLLSPAINLAKYFRESALKHNWSAENPLAVEEFQPNCTGDESGPLGFGFLEDIEEGNNGISVAPTAPTVVVHAESDELVPVSDCKAWCTEYGAEMGGMVIKAHFLAKCDRQGNALDHGLYHFAKPDAVTEPTFKGLLQGWLSES